MRATHCQQILASDRRGSINIDILVLQRSPLLCAPGLVKFVPAVARLFCPALLGCFLTVCFAQNKGDLCTVLRLRQKLNICRTFIRQNRLKRYNSWMVYYGFSFNVINRNWPFLHDQHNGQGEWEDCQYQIIFRMCITRGHGGRFRVLSGQILYMALSGLGPCPPGIL